MFGKNFITIGLVILLILIFTASSYSQTKLEIRPILLPDLIVRAYILVRKYSEKGYFTEATLKIEIENKGTSDASSFGYFY